MSDAMEHDAPQEQIRKLRERADAAESDADKWKEALNRADTAWLEVDTERDRLRHALAIRPKRTVAEDKLVALTAERDRLWRALVALQDHQVRRSGAAADLIRSALDGGGGFDPWLRAEQEDDRRERD